MAKKGKTRRDWEGLDHVIEELTYRVKQIDSWTNDNDGITSAPDSVKLYKKPARSAGTPSVKSKYYQRAADHVKSRLYENKARKQDDELELPTYARYLSRIRIAIRENVSRHSNALPAAIAKLQKNYPEYSEKLALILTESERRVTEVCKKVSSDLLAENKARADELREILKDMLKSGELEHPVIKMLYLTDTQSARLKAEKEERLAAKKEETPVYHIDSLLDVTEKALNASSTYELAVGVGLSTGRRAIEVMYQGIFSKAGTHEIEFSGQAKKGKGVDAESYIIPTVIEADKIIEAVKKIRESSEFDALEKKYGDLPELHRNERINVAVSRMLNYTAKKLLDPNTPRADSDVQFKDTRVIALQIAIKRIRETSKSKGDLNVFVKNFQGHSNFKELENYMHIEVTEDIDKADRNVIKLEEEREIVLADKPANHKALEQADDFLNQLNKKPLWKMHLRAKEFAAKIAHLEGVEINQTILYKGNKSLGIEKCGGSLELIKKYLAIPVVAEAVEEFNKSKQ